MKSQPSSFSGPPERGGPSRDRPYTPVRRRWTSDVTFCGSFAWTTDLSDEDGAAELHTRAGPAGGAGVGVEAAGRRGHGVGREEEDRLVRAHRVEGHVGRD